MTHASFRWSRLSILSIGPYRWHLTRGTSPHGMALERSILFELIHSEAKLLSGLEERQVLA
jgi:hypothetical protein